MEKPPSQLDVVSGPDDCNPDDLECDVCFDQISRLDVYPQPCACRFTICWGCVHLQFKVDQKVSKCPCCRQPNRYERRLVIMNENDDILNDNRGMAYHVEMDLIDNCSMTLAMDLGFLEDMIISIHYMRYVNSTSQCLASLRHNPSMRGSVLPIWARKKVSSRIWSRLLGIRGTLRVVFSGNWCGRMEATR